MWGEDGPWTQKPNSNSWTENVPGSAVRVPFVPSVYSWEEKEEHLLVSSCSLLFLRLHKASFLSFLLMAARVLVLSFLALLWTPLALAGTQNLTIDDADPRFSYSPSGKWTARPGPCSGCQAEPNSSLAYDGTWHDTTFVNGQDLTPFNATVSFSGSAVYVYCIISHAQSDPDGNTDMQFMIDGEIVGSANIPPTGEATYSYNYLVYSGQFAEGQHTLTVVNGQEGGPTSLALLDYIKYTTEVELLPSSTPTASGNATGPASSAQDTQTSASLPATTSLSSHSASPAASVRSYFNSGMGTILVMIVMAGTTLL